MTRRVIGIILCLLLLAATPIANAATADWREPHAEPITITFAMEEPSNAVFAPGDDMGSNIWTRLFKERFNIDLVLEWSTLPLEYDTKLNLVIAAGTLPDMFPCKDWQFDQLKNAGMLADLTDVYTNYASPSLKKMMENNWDIVETAMLDDQILAMPRLHYGFETMTSFLWMRKDWVEQNDISDVKTIEDLENVMKTFMENNDAKYGIMLDKTLNCFYQLAAAFHSAPKIWVDGPDGTIVHGATTEETKQALATWARWYQEGYIRPDFATIDEETQRQDAYNGLVGLYAKENWAGWQVGRDMVENQGDGSYFIAYDLPCIDDEKVMYPIEFANGWYNVVSKDCENPEALVQLINCYVDVLDDSIAEGTMTLEEVLPFNTNDLHHTTGPFKVEFAHYNDIKEVSAACEAGGGQLSTGNAFLFYNEIRKWMDDGDLVGLGRYLQMGYDTSSLARAINHVDNDQILKTKVWGLKPEVLLNYGTTLDDLLVEGFTQIIMGVEDISYFDTLIEAWYNAGGAEATEAVNLMYGN